jgi:hypothetical protein
MACSRKDQTHLEVFHRTDLFGHLRSLCIRHRCEPSLSQSLEGQRVVPQIQLGPDEDHRYARSMVRDLWVPLVDREGSIGKKASPNVYSAALTLVLTFSKLGGLAIEKQTKKTFVCG